MIVGTGIDLVRVERVRDLMERFGERFLKRVFLPDEIRYCLSRRIPHQNLAARVAAKEAGSKALGTGWRNGVHWKCFEVVRAPDGRPSLQLHGRAQEIARELGARNALLSLTHDGDWAIAHVILET